MSDELEWQVASGRKSRRPKRNNKKKNTSSTTSQSKNSSTSVTITKEQIDILANEIIQLSEQIVTTNIYHDLFNATKEWLNTFNESNMVEIVAYGLGSPTQSINSQIQLACLYRLKCDFLPLQGVVAYDPTSTVGDLDLCIRLGIENLKLNEECRRKVSGGSCDGGDGGGGSGGSGSGHAPRCESPCCTAFSDSTRFVTAMIALTPQTFDNGCLLVCPGKWKEHFMVPPSDCCDKCTEKDRMYNKNDSDRVKLTVPTVGGSYGGGGAKGGRVVGGRVVGTLTTEFINELENQCRFQHVECPVGGVLLFDGWVPHRDSVNNTMESRDAVFFVYTTKLDCGGDQHAKYYKRIQLLTARCI
jgi:hypothetical protein